MSAPCLPSPPSPEGDAPPAATSAAVPAPAHQDPMEHVPARPPPPPPSEPATHSSLPLPAPATADPMHPVTNPQHTHPPPSSKEHPANAQITTTQPAVEPHASTTDSPAHVPAPPHQPASAAAPAAITDAKPPAAEEAPPAEPPPASTSRKRSRRASAKSSAARADSASRSLRPRSSSRGGDAGAPDSDFQDPEGGYLHISNPAPSGKTESSEKVDPMEVDHEEGEETTPPRPVQTEKGLRMTVGDTVFVTFDQLEPVKQHRMQGKNLKPIEDLTFADILSYNRDQLRCYCYIYSTPRKKKSEMEVDMARFVSLWNKGRTGFVFSEYVPKNAGRDKPDPSPVAASVPLEDGDKLEKETALRPSRRSSTPSNKAGSVTTTPAKQDLGLSGDQQSPAGRASTSDRAASTPAKTPAKATPKSSTKTPAKTSARTTVRTPASAMPTASAKRPPPRPTNVQPSPIRPNLPPRPPSSERPIAPGRVSSPGVLLPNHAPVSIQAAGSSSGKNSSGGSAKNTRPIVPVQAMPKGFGTSHKQKVYARAAGSKFKAAYNGAGPAIVNIVENAAAYFEGKDLPEVILDRTKSYERYQFNVDLLSEIFDGPPPEAEEGRQDEDVAMKEVGGSDANATVELELAKRMGSRTNGEIASELKMWEENYRKLENATKESDRANMRMFQRLERAETEEEIHAVKRDFEREHGICLPCAPPPLVKRKLDKSLPPVLMPDDKCHILRFKVE